MRIFLDDERFPPRDGNQWIICRDFDEFKAAVEQHGYPSFVSFDHDLGKNKKSGKDVANWLVELDLDSNAMPSDFDYYVHSANPPGMRNIKGLMDNYLTFKRKVV